MDSIAHIFGAALPMAICIFVGSYFGVWWKRDIRLPLLELAGMFVLFWLLAYLLGLLATKVFPSPDDKIAVFWSTLVSGIVIGRTIVSWRCKASRK